MNELRQLNLAVERHIMDGRGHFCCPECGGSWFGTRNPHLLNTEPAQRYCKDEYRQGCRWTGLATDAPPEYSEDIGAAWDVISHMHALGWEYELSRRGDFHRAVFVRGMTVRRATAKTAPWAICQAALAAVTGTDVPV